MTDSVWVDLGYPVQRDPSGKLYKPLFAFMIQGLNGRLPLNTAGNLHQLSYNQPVGDPLGLNVSRAIDHASHIGYSVNEINPEFALDPTGGAPAPGGGKKYLQVLLQGNATDPANPVEGRFGEVALIRASGGTAFPRAGRSWLPGQSSGYSATAYPRNDVFDADFNGYDGLLHPGARSIPHPPPDPTNQTNTLAENADKLDAANAVLLPAERIRRFVTPIDISGNGVMVDFGNPPNGANDFGLGSDNRGRISSFPLLPPSRHPELGPAVHRVTRPARRPRYPLANLSDEHDQQAPRLRDAFRNPIEAW